MSAHLLPAERLEKIKQRLRATGSARVSELSEMLAVSEVTVRADLSQLEREGFLKRTHGGAIVTQATRFERPFAEQVTRYAEEKRRIGAAAAGMVGKGDTIILDVGTTTTQIARHLPHDCDLVVVTSGLNIALELEQRAGITVLVTGGTVRPMQHSLVNPYATLLLSHIHADTLFLGCNGVSVDKGVTNSNLQEAEVKRAMIAAAKRVVVVADNSKIGNVAAAHVASLAEIDTVITDTDADTEVVEGLRRAGVKVMTV